MKTTTEIDILSDELDKPSHRTMTIVSHWGFNDRVWLVIDGERTLVEADALNKAIENATNHSDL